MEINNVMSAQWPALAHVYLQDAGERLGKRAAERGNKYGVERISSSWWSGVFY